MTNQRLHATGDCQSDTCRYCAEEAELHLEAHIAGEHIDDPDPACRRCETSLIGNLDGK